jgi:DnaJ-class molecular chaperone
LKGKGLPSVNSYGTGDLLVNVGVYIPENLSKDEKATIEKLSLSQNVKPNSAASKDFFSRFRKNIFCSKEKLSRDYIMSLTFMLISHVFNLNFNLK